MRSVIIDLTIPASEYVRQYQHHSAVVVARSREGLKVNFPASILRPFVSHAGISGSFRIQFNDAGKFQAIEKLPSS